MKKIKLISLAFIASMVIALPMTSCSSDDEDSPTSEVISDNSSNGSSSSSSESDDDGWEIRNTRSGRVYWLCPVNGQGDKTTVSCNIWRNRYTKDYRTRWAGKYYYLESGKNTLVLDTKSHRVNGKTHKDSYMLEINI